MLLFLLIVDGKVSRGLVEKQILRQAVNGGDGEGWAKGGILGGRSIVIGNSSPARRGQVKLLDGIERDDASVSRNRRRRLFSKYVTSRRPRRTRIALGTPTLIRRLRREKVRRTTSQHAFLRRGTRRRSAMTRETGTRYGRSM